MKLSIYQDNGSRYHWQLVNDDGIAVAGSVNTYASREDARKAAQQVHDEAAAMVIEAA